MVLVDSSIWIEAARRQGDLEAKVSLEALLEEYEAATTSPVLLEVLGGARKEDRQRMRGYFDVIPHVLVDAKDWDHAVEFAWQLKDKGHSLPWNDVLIASVAIRRDLRVYAQDKHFEVMAAASGLRLYRPGYGGTYVHEETGG
ncbi:MAG: PIN domain-containing protein [Prosthecobacter sp.]|nr:PIN domain-containing protein [Prosthecobacter sp.]